MNGFDRSAELVELEKILRQEGFIFGTSIIDYKKIKKVTGIPERTIRSWFSGERNPAPWVISLLKYYFTTGGFR